VRLVHRAFFAAVAASVDDCAGRIAVEVEEAVEGATAFVLADGLLWAAAALVIQPSPACSLRATDARIGACSDDARDGATISTLSRLTGWEGRPTGLLVVVVEVVGGGKSDRLFFFFSTSSSSLLLLCFLCFLEILAGGQGRMIRPSIKGGWFMGVKRVCMQGAERRNR